MTNNNDYAKELLSIKTEINALRQMISDAVEQFKTAIESFTATPQSPKSSDMDTDVEASPEPKDKDQNPITQLADLIQDLKYDIATIVTESRMLFKKQLLMSNNPCPPPPVT